jgi:hypothetical protein
VSTPAVDETEGPWRKPWRPYENPPTTAPTLDHAERRAALAFWQEAGVLDSDGPIRVYEVFESARAILDDGHPRPAAVMTPTAVEVSILKGDVLTQWPRWREYVEGLDRRDDFVHEAWGVSAVEADEFREVAEELVQHFVDVLMGLNPAQ